MAYLRDVTQSFFPSSARDEGTDAMPMSIARPFIDDPTGFCEQRMSSMHTLSDFIDLLRHVCK